MTARRPFENRELVATKNTVKVTAANSQYVKILLDARWDFPGDLTLSFLYKHNGVPTGNQIVFLTDDTKASYMYFITRSISPNTPLIQIRTTTSNFFNINSDDLSIDVTKATTRITITRISNVFYCYFNTRLVQFATAGGNVNFSLSEYIALGGGFGTSAKMDGWVGNLIALNGKGMSHDELKDFHHTNIIPVTCHPFVIGHYPLNHDSGAVAYDVTPQYNYSKSTPLNAIHGNLINYNAADIGTTNKIIENAWHNLYESGNKGNLFLKGNDSNMYAEIPGYSYALGSPATWSLYVEVAQRKTAAGYETAFCGGNLSNAQFAIFLVGPDNVTIFYQSVSIVSVVPKLNDGILIHKIWLVYNSPNVTCYIDNNPLLTNSVGVGNIGFDFFRFFRQNSSNELYSSEGVGRSVFLNKVFNAHERYAIENNLPEYRNFTGLQFDLDFGNIFLSGSDYFVKDNSANNRDAQLFNFVPASNPPILLEHSTGIPPVAYALKFNGTNQYLSVASFNPTKEKGYTYIIGFCLNSNRNFGNEYLLAKRENTNARAKLLYSNGANKLMGFLHYIPPHFLDGIGNNNFVNYDTSKPLLYCSVNEMSAQAKSLPFGFFQANTNDITPGLGWDEVDSGALFIGSDDINWSATGYLNGFIFFVGIWKGILKQHQIIDLMNNSLCKNPTPELMQDCELFLNFDSIINTSGTYTVKDHSPLNRTVVLNNYSADEINPAHANYRLIDLNTLR